MSYKIYFAAIFISFSSVAAPILSAPIEQHKCKMCDKDVFTISHDKVPYMMLSKRACCVFDIDGTLTIKPLREKLPATETLRKKHFNRQNINLLKAYIKAGVPIIISSAYRGHENNVAVMEKIGELFDIEELRGFTPVNIHDLAIGLGYSGAVSAHQNSGSSVFVVSSCGNKSIDFLIGSILYEQYKKTHLPEVHKKNDHIIRDVVLIDDSAGKRAAFINGIESNHVFFKEKDWLTLRTYDHALHNGVMRTIISPHRRPIPKQSAEDLTKCSRGFRIPYVGSPNFLKKDFIDFANFIKKNKIDTILFQGKAPQLFRMIILALQNIEPSMVHDKDVKKALEIFRKVKAVAIPFSGRPGFLKKVDGVFVESDMGRNLYTEAGRKKMFKKLDQKLGKSNNIMLFDLMLAGRANNCLACLLKQWAAMRGKTVNLTIKYGDFKNKKPQGAYEVKKTSNGDFLEFYSMAIYIIEDGKWKRAFTKNVMPAFDFDSRRSTIFRWVSCFDGQQGIGPIKSNYPKDWENDENYHNSEIGCFSKAIVHDEVTYSFAKFLQTHDNVKRNIFKRFMDWARSLF